MARSVYQSFRSYLLFALLFAFTQNASAQISDYGFPELSSDLATICSPMFHVPKANSENLHVQVLKSTPEVRRNKLVVRFYPAKVDGTNPQPQRSRELLVVLSGLGSEANSVFTKFYAQIGQESGFNVLAFPNTLTPNFIKSSSTRGLVGETPVDAADLYRAIEASVQKLKTKHNVEVDSIKIIGFSHGALLAAAVDAHNETARGLPIKSVMMVNTPVSLLAGLRNLDARAKAAKKIPLPRLIKLGLRFSKMIKKRTTEPTTIDTYRKFTQDLRYKPQEQYAIIGMVMRMGLNKTIIAGQEIEDLGILPELSPEGSVVRRQEEAALSQFASRFSFEKYIDTFFGAQAKKDGTVYDIRALEARSSLPAYENHLRRSKHITLVHNLDDILLGEGDADYLKNIFGSRVHFYPRGGHMGNIWYKDNLESYKNWLLK